MTNVRAYFYERRVMGRESRPWVRAALLLATLCAGWLCAVRPAFAQTEKVLYSFGTQSGDGENPYGGVIMDAEGNLYGTTSSGGANGKGTVFKVTASGEESVLYSFCSQPGCADGANPWASLIMDAEGNLYGTTLYGGAGGGTVFKVTPSGAESVLHSFCSPGACGDGANPNAALIMDGDGNLYSTTYQGGVSNEKSPCQSSGCGTVFKVTATGAESVLYNFCSQSECTDGFGPVTPLIMDGSGNLYGTAEQSGTGGGTVFEISAGGEFSVLYTLLSQPGDGSFPYAGLVMDNQGNLYGTTTLGPYPNYYSGTVYKVASSGNESVLYTFCSQPNCADGQLPYAGLILDKDGNLYGTTSSGGTGIYGSGNVFEVSAAGEFSVLYNFCTRTNCNDGAVPDAALIMDKDGNFYGTTNSGGEKGGGTVFRLSPAVSLLPSSYTYRGTKVGSTSPAHKFTLKNNQPIALTGISYSTAAPFAVSSSTCGTTLNSKASCTISVTFSPTQAGTATGTLTVRDSAANSPQTSSLTGNGTTSGQGMAGWR